VLRPPCVAVAGKDVAVNISVALLRLYVDCMEKGFGNYRRVARDVLAASYIGTFNALAS
jgi:hypothetical protein